MDLFTKKEKGKEILDNGRKVIINLKSNGKKVLTMNTMRRIMIS